jgi:hypothetical protein
MFTMPQVTETAINTYTEKSVTTPVAVVANGKMLVMELLRLFLYIAPPDNIAGAGTSTMVAVHISRKSKTSSTKMNDVDVIGYHEIFLNNATAVGICPFPDNTKILDFTDGKGNGLLYAAKEIFIGIKGIANAVVKTANGKMLYRLKAVDPVDYIGIVAE